MATPVAAGGFGPTEPIRVAPPGVPLDVGDIDLGGNLAVVWQEGRQGDRHSYLRWSGTDQAPTSTLHGLHGGGRAADPRVATCGDAIWSVSTWPSAREPRVGLDLRTVPPSELLTDRSVPVGVGRAPDVACHVGMVAAAWFDDSAGPAQVKVLLWRWGRFCGDDCLVVRRFDLGRGDPGRGLGIAISRDEAAGGRHPIVHVAWVRAGGLRLGRISIRPDGDVIVRPTATVLRAESVRSVQLGADDLSHILLAYHERGDTRARLSEDRGLTFGPTRIVWRAPCRDCEAGSLPTAADVAGPWLLVEAFGGDPGGDSSRGFVSNDGGERWSAVSDHPDGRQVGALQAIPESDDAVVVEVWDRSVQDPAPRRARLRFHRGLASH